MLDRLTSMQIFVEAARLGSLSAAGRMLKISPAMASKYLDALENRLDVKLLHRSTRQLRLTDAGKDYLSSCRRILQCVAEADAEVTALSTEARPVTNEYSVILWCSLYCSSITRI